MKIKCHRRDHIDLLAVTKTRFWPPLLTTATGGIRERRVALQKVSAPDAGISSRVTWSFTITCKPARCARAGTRALDGKLTSRFWKSSGSSAIATLKVDFKIHEPAFEPVPSWLAIGTGASGNKAGDVALLRREKAP